MDSATSNTGPSGTAGSRPARILPSSTNGYGRAMPACRHTGQRRRPRTPPVDVLLCGIDNLLITYDAAVAGQIETTHGIPPGRLLDTLLEWPTAKLASVGAIDHATWLRYAYQSLPRKAVDEWLAHHGNLNQPVADLLHAPKRAGLRLYLLGNGTHRTHDDLAHHQLTELADRTYLFADIGYAKPDPRAYHHVLHHNAADPTRTLYIDHNPAWVHTARQLGMRGLTYHNNDQLTHALTQVGIAI